MNAAVWIACAISSACALPRTDPPTTVPADTLRGTVSVVGSEPGTGVAIRTLDGRAFTLLGERPLLDRLAGLEVTVWGEAGPLQASLPREAFRVSRFAVRTADGLPAVDGILETSAGGSRLVKADGSRVRLRSLPAALEHAAGGRVWLVLDTERRIMTYGIIEMASPGH